MTELEKMGMRAKAAAKQLRSASDTDKRDALLRIADALVEHEVDILTANAEDIHSARTNGMADSMIDRLALSKDRIRGMADGVRAVAEWPDPVGAVIEEKTLPNGLLVRKTSVPLGVIGIIFESRPNVTSDCAALCIRAGNACILRGGKEAFRSNRTITKIMRDALAESAIPEDAVQLVLDINRSSATELMNLTRYLDVLIPRGGAGLIRSVVDNAKVPVIETGAGNCHIYVDRDADINMAAEIIFNAKTQRPSVCNAAEKVLLHKDIAEEALPVIAAKLREKDVELRGDEAARTILPNMNAATAEDWSTEYIALIMGIKVVNSIDEAIDHIETYGTHHSDCIITRDPEAARKFQTEVDSAAVYWNASTRFTDGGEMGLGAEIGISTQKLHARGPMGLEELTTYKYIVKGSGQVR